MNNKLKDEDLENNPAKKEVVSSHIENAESFIDTTIDEVNLVATQNLTDKDVVTQRLINLGADQLTIDQVLERMAVWDRRIEAVQSKTQYTLSEAMSFLYTETIEHIDKSILAEFKMRPIHNKIDALKKTIEKVDFDDGYSLGKLVSWDNKTRNAIYDSFITLHKYGEASNKLLPKDISKSLKEYNELNQYRRFQDTLNIGYKAKDENVGENLNILYGANLLVIAESKNSDDIVDSLNAFFQKSSMRYQDSNYQTVFSKKNSIPENKDVNFNYNYERTPLVYRVDAFSKCVKENKIALPGEAVDVLKQKVLEIIENPSERFIDKTRYYSTRLTGFLDLLDIAKFTEEQKHLIYRNIFSQILSSNHPVNVISVNPTFPYSKEEQQKIFELIKQSDLNKAIQTQELPFITKEQKQIILEKHWPADQSVEDFLKAHDGDLGSLFSTLRYNQSFDIVSEEKIRDVMQIAYSRYIQSKDWRSLSYLESESKYLSEEQRIYVSVISRIYKSQSNSLKNLAPEIAQQILNQKDVPDIQEVMKEVEDIEEIFIKNNLPYVGKQFKIFQVLYPEQRFKDSFRKISSPELLSHPNTKEQRLILFKDLMKVNIGSLNSDLESYLKILEKGAGVLEKFENKEQLTEVEQKQLDQFLRKIDTLADNIRSTDDSEKKLENTEEVERLRKSFGVRKGEKIIDKFNRTFLQRIGIADIYEALRYYELLREQTDFRNRNEIVGNKIKIEKGDLLKGVSSEFLDTFLDRGVLCPEFVGADTSRAKEVSKNSDATPWDTDVIRYSNNLFENKEYNFYGDISLLIKDRGQFNETKHDSKNKPTSNQQMELFKTGVVSKDHYGVRTGIPSSEIDAILVHDFYVEEHRAFIDGVKYTIAKKGFYIPISDQKGNVAYSPKEYDQFRKIFSGIERFHGEKINVSEDWKRTAFAKTIQENTASEVEKKEITAIRIKLFQEIESILQKNNIRIHEGEFDDSVFGARIADTGSTARGSNIEKSYDFDLVVKLDEKDFSNIKFIVGELGQKFKITEDYTQDNLRTVRLKEIDFNGKTIDLDISFTLKGETNEFDANKAIEEKYTSIKNESGEQILAEVLANIRFAKKKLKDAGCYKKGTNESIGQQGGLGGIGVETWILQHDGDSIRAFKAFRDVAYRGNTLIPLKEFKEQYTIFGAGKNIRANNGPENFVHILTEDAYKKIAKLAREIA